MWKLLTSPTLEPESGCENLHSQCDGTWGWVCNSVKWDLVVRWLPDKLKCHHGFRFFFFNCGIGPLQECAAKWISYMYRYNPFLLGLPSHPSGHHRAPSWAPCAFSRFSLAISFTRGSHIPTPISQSPTLHVHTFVPFILVSISALKIGSSVSFF